jgi:mRNA interferase RelE/StbE
LSEFRVFETEEFVRSLGRLQPQDSIRIRRKLETHVFPQVRQEPFFGPNIRKFHGCSPGTWRYRIGMFRIFYAVDAKENVIYMLSLDFRRDAYR